MRWWFLPILLVSIGAVPSDARRPAAARDPLVRLPPLMLWAWERPEDLRFIDPATTGVAYLAGTLQLEGDRVDARPRLHLLRVPPETTVMAVVRIETSHRVRPALDDTQVEEAVRQLLWLFSRSGLAAVQIDFDATVSERDFYRRLLQRLRRGIPLPLSITALASWCLGDPWITDLPVDEAVPMLFEMGPEGSAVVQHLRRGGDFSSARARLAVGVSTGEPVPIPVGRRVYVFHPRPWDAATWEALQ